MTEVDYEYCGLIARGWDLLRGDTSEFPDRHFFREVIKTNGAPALIVGCGTGRLLLEFLSDGIDVDGLDISPEMLEICKKKADELNLHVTLYPQAMEKMALPRSYQSILVPSASFQLVPEISEAQATLARFWDHLQPGGILVMSIWHIGDGGGGGWRDWWMVGEEEGFEGDKVIRRWERSMYDPRSHLRHTENRYELLLDGEVVYTEHHRRSPELRNYSLPELMEMMEKAGFLDIRAVSGFTIDSATDEDEVFCMFGSKG